MYYVAHRLFALHDRALAALVASELTRHVGPHRVFLPFCDTNEEDLVAACKGLTLFELDSMRLQALDGMVAILHGPSADDGVCMEIGYAAHLGVPVVGLTTDFQTYGLSADGRTLQFPDPLLEVLLAGVVRSSRLGPPAESPSHDRFRVFIRRNIAPLRAAARSAVETLLAHPRHVSQQPNAASAVGGAPDRRAFVEPSPYQSLDTWDPVQDLLGSRGWDVQVARRWDIPGGLPQAELLARAHSDWSGLAGADLLVVDVNGPEAPPGAALLIGASVAADRHVLAAYADRSFTFAPGREANFRNLMIQYAINGRFRTVIELAKLLDDA